MFDNCLDTQADKPTACLCRRSLCRVGHLRILITLMCHQHRCNLWWNVSLFTPRPCVTNLNQLGRQTQQCCNYGVLDHQNDISTRRYAKSQRGLLGLPLLSSEWREKLRFFHCCIIIVIGIYESHQTVSQEEAAFEGDSGVHLVRQRTQWNKTFRQPVSSHQAF